MDELSKEKLQEIKNSKNLSNVKISELTGIPLNTIEKIFSGANKNPTINTLKKIAKVLDCTIDDFIDYEVEPTSQYYYDRQTAKIAEYIKNNDTAKMLFDNTKDMSPEIMLALIEVAKAMKYTKK